jgi:hypothetical protein
MAAGERRGQDRSPWRAMRAERGMIGWRLLVTCLLWLAGAWLAALLEGQSHTNSLLLILGCAIVSVLWATMLWKRPRPQWGALCVALLFVVGNLLLLVWTALHLQEAREHQETSHHSLQLQDGATADPDPDEAATEASETGR